VSFTAHDMCSSRHVRLS